MNLSFRPPYTPTIQNTANKAALVGGRDDGADRMTRALNRSYALVEVEALFRNRKSATLRSPCQSSTSRPLGRLAVCRLASSSSSQVRSMAVQTCPFSNRYARYCGIPVPRWNNARPTMKRLRSSAHPHRPALRPRKASIGSTPARRPTHFGGCHARLIGS